MEMRTLNGLDTAISVYQAALDCLPQVGESDASSRIMTVLLSRDEVARELAESRSVPASTTILIASLDEKLKNASATIDAAAGRQTLADWRQSIHPLKNAWWWSLDERAAAAEPAHNPLWTIPAALLFILSLGVIADTITTLRNGGLNRLSLFGTIMQSLLALVAGSAFLSGGREWLEKLFSKIGVNRKFQGKSRVYLGLGMLALTIAISVLLPNLVARYRNWQGNKYFAEKQYADAVQNYQQAVALEPAFVRAHFNLAVAYDRSHDYANAVHEYERSIDFDPENYVAYNNVARLYILHSKDYNGALRRLDSVRTNLTKVPTGLHYYLFKNQGWANLELHNYAQAEGDLLWALELRAREQRDGVAAHYLLGRVYEEQSRSDEAKQHWDEFIKAIQNNPGTDEEVEPNWAVHAQEQLWKGGTK